MKQKGRRIVVSIGISRETAVRLEDLAQRKERSVAWLASRFVVRGLDQAEAGDKNDAAGQLVPSDPSPRMGDALLGRAQ